MQVQISSVFYIFFFIPNLKDVGSNPDTVSKTLKLCLHKYEIFPPLFSSKGLRTCRTMVKVTEKYSTQKRRLGFAALYIVTLCLGCITFGFFSNKKNRTSSYGSPEPNMEPKIFLNFFGRVPALRWGSESTYISKV